MEENNISNQQLPNSSSPPIKKNYWGMIITALIILGVVAGGLWVFNSFRPTPAYAPTTENQATSQVSTSTPSGVESWKTYRNEKYGFEVEYPKEWYAIEPTVDTGFAIQNYQDARTSNDKISITVGLELTLEQFLSNRNTHPTTFKDGVIHERYMGTLVNRNTGEIQEVSIDKNPGYRWEGETVRSNFPGNNYEIQIITLKGGEHVRFLGSVIQQGTRENISIVNQILSTFKFIEPTSQIDTSNWKTYTNSQYGFEVKYPTSWSIDKDKSSTNEVVFNTDETSPSHESVSFKTYSGSLSDWKNSFNQSVILSTKNLVVAGQSALQIDTSEFATTGIGIVYSGKLFIFTTQGAILENGTLSTFKFTERDKKSVQSQPIDTLKVGDSVGGMTVKNIKKYYNQPERLLSDDNGEIIFEGKTEVSGNYEFNAPNEAFVGNLVCFTVFQDEVKNNKFFQVILPNEGNVVYFCFDNQDEARKEFGPQGSTGRATIEMNTFTATYCGCEAVDKAGLVKVIKKD